MASFFGQYGPSAGLGLKSAGSGAEAGAAFGPWGAVIGGGLGLLGGLLDDSAEKEEKMMREKMALEKEAMAENSRQFNTTMDFNRDRERTANKQWGFGALAEMRFNAMQRGKQYRFNNALYNTLSRGQA